ncbi:ParB N-terminal domain-containing protein [Streptomyces griseus]|uniref:ParB N-terminal domain-containing protein n=1 Tax=Streptomyces griseus TaxID=1911 RepID=UPI0037FA10B3
MSDRPEPDAAVGPEKEVVRLLVARLVLEGSPRSAGEDEQHIRTLAAAEEELPPIIVHQATMRVIDGAHRVRAARLRGEQVISARYFRGSALDAFVLGVRANVGHGLPLLLKDRLAAAERIVGTHPQWSDRMIATSSGVSARTVGEMRRRMSGKEYSGTRVGRDGRARPVDAARRRSLASDLLTENPGLSLRQVAEVAGLSPETVRAVRNRLLYGKQPAPRPAGTASRAPTGGPVGQEELLRRLAADPAVRQSDAGRFLLRALRAQTIGGADWQRIVDRVPPHCAALVEQAARESARLWMDVAVRIARKSATAD